ncbi:hypothetical protein R1flu_026476 [Riccia fluitans]|uniref:Uncharacterized protein n=1 Tax=Riccia fluitans TaxID=41844 RepID=A0ABD1XK45_9MARC
MKIKKDGHLVEPLDPDVDAKSQKTPKKKQMGSEQPSRKRSRSESNLKDGNEGNLPSAMKTSRKGKRKVIKSSHRPDVDTYVDIPAEERRTLKIGMTASRLEMDPPLSTPTRQTSGRGSNHIPASDTTKEVPPTSSKVPSNDLAHAKLEEEKLKATIEALEKEKSEMNARVALMERKDLYDLLEAKMEGFQIANHPRTIGGFENPNLIITKKWVEIPAKLGGVREMSRGFPGVVVGTLPNSLAIFEYMQSIFDSYVNPNDDPNVQPLVKGLDADDFSVDKFFGLQDPTSPDGVQANPGFEEDLRTNERLRLQAEARNLRAEPQR